MHPDEVLNSVSYIHQILVLTVVLLVVTMAVSLQAQIRHSGDSDATHLASCAEVILHKRVLLHPNMPFKELAPLCTNQSRDEFLALLKSHSVAVKEDGDWAYLLPADYFGPWPSYTMEGEKLRWKNLKVDVSVANVDPKLSQTEGQLKPEQLQKLKEQILEQARLVPVFEPHPQAESEIAKVILNFTVYLRHMRKDGPVSLLVVVREGDDSSVDGRIVYGEQQPGGGYQLLWDSPIVIVRDLGLGFLDVDDDGVEEVVLRSAYPSGMRDLGSLSIFDIRGNELTRNKPCNVPALYGYSAADGACPIVGESVDLDYSHGPPYDIYVNKSLADGEDMIFKLRAGHYIHLSPVRHGPARRPARNR